MDDVGAIRLPYVSQRCIYYQRIVNKASTTCYEFATDCDTGLLQERTVLAMCDMPCKRAGMKKRCFDERNNAFSCFRMKNVILRSQTAHIQS